jgi:hypothetical protein
VTSAILNITTFKKKKEEAPEEMTKVFVETQPEKSQTQTQPKPQPKPKPKPKPHPK